MSTKPYAERVAPLKSEEMTEAQAKFLAPFRGKDGAHLNIFATLARHLPILEAWRDFGLYTMRGSTVDPILREIAILRAAHNANCRYEWTHHCTIGRNLGMDDELLNAIKTGARLNSDAQQLMVTCADELCRDQRLADRTWQVMQSQFGLAYTLDLIFTVGAYTTLAMALNSCGVQLEEGPH